MIQKLSCVSHRKFGLLNRRHLIAPLILCLVFSGVVGTSRALLNEDAVLVTRVIGGDNLEIKEERDGN